MGWRRGVLARATPGPLPQSPSETPPGSPDRMAAPRNVATLSKPPTLKLMRQKKRRSLPAPPSRHPLEEEHLARRVAAGVGRGRGGRLGGGLLALGLGLGGRREALGLAGQLLGGGHGGGEQAAVFAVQVEAGR